MDSRQTTEGRATSSGLDSPVRAKVAIVSDASRGIGREIAERLLDTGYCVVANSRNIALAKTLQPADRLKLVDGDIESRDTGSGFCHPQFFETPQKSASGTSPYSGVRAAAHVLEAGFWTT